MTDRMISDEKFAQLQKGPAADQTTDERVAELREIIKAVTGDLVEGEIRRITRPELCILAGALTTRALPIIDTLTEERDQALSELFKDECIEILGAKVTEAEAKLDAIRKPSEEMVDKLARWFCVYDDDLTFDDAKETAKDFLKAIAEKLNDPH